MSLNTTYRDNVRPLLDAVDGLRDTLRGEKINLPSIVVVGDQSSGKSSVLEGISGVALPRGEGIVTRCPLVLRMVCLQEGEPTPLAPITSSSSSSSSSSTQQQEWKSPCARIGAEGEDDRWISIEKIESAIVKMTNKIAGTRSSVVDKPIHLTVYRPEVPDLTLIDLPGITRNAVGDQPKNIGDIIQAIIKQYITPEETIILNVIPANIDFSTSETLRMSREVDPNGLRTLGVVTKIDLATRGIANRLQAKGERDLPLKMGYVAVRNRSQAEIEGNISHEEARQVERDYFLAHEELRDLPPYFLGTDQLALKLCNIQAERIRAVLPQKIKEIMAQSKAIEESIARLPKVHSSLVECQFHASGQLRDAVSDLTRLFQGDNAPAKGNKQLHITTRLMELFSNFKKEVDRSTSEFLTDYYSRLVKDAMAENMGVGLPNFLSHPALQQLVTAEIHKLRSPCEALINDATSFMTRAVEDVGHRYFEHTERLLPLVMAELSTCIEKTKSKIDKRISQTLEIEENSVFTLSPYYLDLTKRINASIALHKNPPASTSVATVSLNPAAVSISDVTVDLTSLVRAPVADQPTVEMQISVYAYWQVVYKRVVDQVALDIRHYFGCLVRRDMYDHLQRIFMTRNLLEDMRESEAAAHAREDLMTSSTRLKKAMEVLRRIERA
eukprot:TRINITY_DN5709_c0_g1_i1.p1 TRINITY_DN5709_c0_g1~~TRINITY_DN5709_c0_g1_i1.p1  ORF type:complete len:670 (-),score=121.19 TRINITY_DN5709_c0_g1_i1:8-2017(-)